MPPPFVKTIREEILYEYAKLISRFAHGSLERAVITDRFKKLRNGEISISGNSNYLCYLTSSFFNF